MLVLLSRHPIKYGQKLYQRSRFKQITEKCINYYDDYIPLKEYEQATQVIQIISV